MDIIVMNKDFVDIGVVQNTPFDYEGGVDAGKCTFQISTLIDDSSIQLGDYVYIDGTEYGGRVDIQKVDTGKGVTTSSGRTWRGILGSKIIESAEGEDYYTVTGDLNYIISQVITKVELSDLFEVDDTTTETVTFKFDRYTTAYDGIIKMLAKYGYKLSLMWNHGKVMLKSTEIVDYTNENGLTSDLFDFVIQKNTATVNHMIGLGIGELSERLVVEKYVQADGTIGDTQYYFGVNEITSVYNSPNTQTLEELEANVTKKLLELSTGDSLEIKTQENLNADVGDKFTAHDVTTGLTITQYVTDKIVNIDNDVVKIDYEIGGAIK